MCHKCHYSLIRALGDILNKDPEKCFIQLGVRSGNVIVRQITTYVSRALIRGYPIANVRERVQSTLGRAVSEARLSYEEAVQAVPIFKQHSQEDKTYGGLLDDEVPGIPVEAPQESAGAPLCPAMAQVDRIPMGDLEQKWQEAENQTVSLRPTAVIEVDPTSWE